MSLHHMGFFKKIKNAQTLKEVCNFLDRQMLLSQVYDR
jgi:hypothetical protein